MEPSPSTAASATKLRLMCSYGGQIIPRPQTKSLFYAGGDTRIITVPTTTATNLTFPFLVAHLAAALRLGTPFTLKYQLPCHDLDSLITLSTDEDVAIMLEEHNRVFPSPARIRLFVFPAKSASGVGAKPGSNSVELGGGSELTHPKKESWFVDVLESAKIMQRGGVAGYAGEAHGEGNNNGGGEAIVGICGAESMVLETSSSFGSTSSSTSSSNVPAKVQIEDSGARILDNKLKSSSPEPILSDRGLGGTVVSRSHQDSAGLVATTEGKVATNHHSELQGDMHRAVQTSTFPPSFQFDQPQQVHYVHSGGLHYGAPNPAGVMQMQMPAYYMMNNSPLTQQPVYYQQTNQPRPIYFVPVTQAYSNVPMQTGMVSSSIGNRPPLHPSSSMNPAQVSYKVAPISSPRELFLPMNLQTQPAAVVASTVDKANYSNEDDDEDAATHAQIYKSQPPPPPAALQSQYQTMTKGTTTLLADALAQLHTDNIKPPLISR